MVAAPRTKAGQRLAYGSYHAMLEVYGPDYRLTDVIRSIEDEMESSISDRIRSELPWYWPTLDGEGVTGCYIAEDVLALVERPQHTDVLGSNDGAPRSTGSYTVAEPRIP